MTRQEYALELMQAGHPRTSAARAAGCYLPDLPTSVRRESVRFEARPVVVAMPQSPATRIMTDVAAAWGVTVAGLRNKRHTRRYAWARHHAMAEIRKACAHLSLPAIGRMFNRDHSTVWHGIENHNARVAWTEFLIWAGNPEGLHDPFSEAK